MPEKKKNKKNKLRELRKEIEKDGTKLDEFYEELLKNLTENVDYGELEITTKNKKKYKFNSFLRKAGAEHVLLLLGQSASKPKLIQADINMFLYTVDVFDSEGNHLGIGYGAGDPTKGINKELKLGKKRCLVDGVISSNYLSGLFVQDEDSASESEYQALMDYAMKVANELGDKSILENVTKALENNTPIKNIKAWLRRKKEAKNEEENGQ